MMLYSINFRTIQNQSDQTYRYIVFIIKSINYHIIKIIHPAMLLPGEL
jgi:hypothetical protein